MPGKTPDESQQLAALEKQLQTANIPFRLWGQRSTKRVVDLLHEIQEGEIVLIQTNTQDGTRELRRQVRVAEIKIFYTEESTNARYQLKETRQVFTDGRGERKRHLEASLQEKMKPTEEPEQAMRRGITEELGIPAEALELTLLGTRRQIQESPSYPGLRTDYVLTLFEMHMPKAHYQPEGYQEQQPDKTTYFEWQPVLSSL